MNDEKIVALYFNRDEAAISETEKKYGKLCFSISNNILKSVEDSKECVNDTYIALWEKIPPLVPISLKAYICKVIRNISFKKFEYIHADKRNPDLLVSLDEISEISSDSEIKDGITEEELSKHISDFLKTETEIHRKVFIRKYFYFDSIKEIAEDFYFTEEKIKSMLYRTREKLKLYLKKEGVIL